MKRFISIIICLVISLSICSVPSYAVDSEYKTYVFTNEEMDALLSTCVGTYNITSGSTAGTNGSATFKKSINSSPPLFILENTQSGGPNANVTFNLDFELDLSCGSITVQEFVSYLFYNTTSGSDPVYSGSSRPTYGYFYLNSSIASQNPTIIDGQLQYGDRLVNGRSRINRFTFNSLTNVNGFSSQFSTSWSMIPRNVFVYAIQSIEYTAPAPVVDNLQEAINAIISNDNKNTQDIIDNYNAKAAEIMQNIGENTDKILDDLNTSKPEDVEKLEDYQAGVDSVQSKADEISSALDSVQEPDLDSVDFDIAKDLDGSSVSPMFDIIFGDFFIISLISFSITISVLSLLLFGKKS